MGQDDYDDELKELFRRLPSKDKRSLLAALCEGSTDLEVEALFLQQLSRTTAEHRKTTFLFARQVFSRYLAERQGINSKTQH